MSLADFNQAILDFFVWSGQESRALDFYKELGPGNARLDISRLEAAIELKEAVSAHEFKKAWQLALEIDGTKLVSQPHFEICFAIAEIAESIIQKRPALAIIEQARESVAPLISKVSVKADREKFELLLEHLVSSLVIPQSQPLAKKLLDSEFLEHWVLEYVQEFLRSEDKEPNLLMIYAALV